MRNRILSIFLVAAIFFGILAGCAKSKAKDDKVIATIGSRSVMMSDFNKKIEKLPAYYQTIAEQNKEHFLDEMILETLLYEEAIRKSLERDEEVRSVLAEAKKKILVAKLIKNEVDSKVAVSASEAKFFYEEHKDEFKSPQLYRASHILVADEKKARELLDELAKGAKFEDLAKANSMDATATRGGDIGYFRMGQLVPDFEKTCMKLEVGRTSDVVRTQFGYHIIKLTDRKEEGIELFEKAAPAIEDILKKKKRGELFEQMVAGLKRKYDVSIKEDAFLSPEAKDAGKEKDKT